MPPATERRWSAARRQVRLWVWLGLAGCVSTDGGGQTAPAICIEAPRERMPNDSVVLVTGNLREAGETTCSGIALTPRLVLTNLLCLVMPAQLVASDLDTPLNRPSFEGTDLYGADVDYAGSCESNNGWAPNEDGSFAAWLGKPLDASALAVNLIRDEQLVTSAKVRHVFLPGAASRCWDTIAALVLEDALQVVPRPARVLETSRIGEPVTLSAFSTSFTVPVERPAQIEAITFQDADTQAPPRSLLLSEQVCFYESGGAVLSAETGAAVAVIAYGTGNACGDPAGRTVATRLAPYQRLLEDAADEAGETLPVEQAPSPVRHGVGACADE